MARWPDDFRARVKKLKEMRGGKCLYCGAKEDLVFHHRDPTTKEFSPAGATKSWDRLVREAKKCDLLCSSCHRDEHRWRGDPLPQSSLGLTVDDDSDLYPL
jgi:5-methylcytosine-specific restriction endonuclease McrA